MSASARSPPPSPGDGALEGRVEVRPRPPGVQAGEAEPAGLVSSHPAADPAASAGLQSTISPESADPLPHPLPSEVYQAFQYTEISLSPSLSVFLIG